ncbi:MAG: hypothetical protein ACWGQW_02855 [bacterium]
MRRHRSTRRNQDKYPGWEQHEEMMMTELLMAAISIVLGLAIIGYALIFYPKFFLYLGIWTTITVIVILAIHAIKLMVIRDHNRTRTHKKENNK